MKILIAAMFIAFTGTAIAQQTNTLDTLRQTYEKHQQSILLSYGKSLDTIMADAKRKGNLDSVLILQAEQKRFTAEKTIPDPIDAKDLLRSTSEAYYRPMFAVVDWYVKALDALIKRQVMTDQIEAAKVVKTEKDKAAVILAEMQTKLSMKMAGGKRQTDSAVDRTDSEKTSANTNLEKRTGRILGVWSASFSNSAKRKYEFLDDGTMTMVEVQYGGNPLSQNSSVGTWAWKKFNDQAIVDINGTLDVWTRQGSAAWGIIHYNPKSAYPRGNPSTTGKAQR